MESLLLLVAEMRVFRGVPLDPSRREIRLLKIDPDIHESSVHAELFTASFEQDMPEFRAISYAWDLNGPKKTIVVNGIQFEICENIYVLLKKIPRQSTYTVNLWIDTICINQEDLCERNTQVPLMKDIYSKASRVLVWLGDGNESTDLAFAVMNKFNTWWNLDLGSINLENDDMQTIEQLYMRNLKHFVNKSTPVVSLIRGLIDIFSREWFRRTWTLQEVALPPNDPLVLCGDSSVSWSCLGIAHDRMIRELGLPAISRFLRLYGGLGDEELAKVHKFDENFRPITAAKIRSLYRSLDRDHDQLAVYIHHASRQISTDPRDKIYGLLGLGSSMAHQFIPVDYKKTLQDICLDAFKFLASYQNGFQILSRAALPGLDKIPGWPSWLPRLDTVPWQGPCQLIQEYLGRCDVYKASLSLSPGYELIDLNRGLVIYGILIDEVTEIGTPVRADTSWQLRLNPILDGGAISDIFFPACYPCEDCDWCMEGPQDVCRAPLYSPKILSPDQSDAEDVWVRATFLKDAVSGALVFHGSPLGEAVQATSPARQDKKIDCWDYQLRKPITEAIWRAIIGDHLAAEAADTDGIPAPPRAEYLVIHEYPDLESGIPFCNRVEEKEASTEERMLVTKSAMRMIGGRSAFRTLNGFIGFGPSTLEVGDKIVVIAGADVPFALRSRGDSESFTLVGECYVEGLMHGELFRQHQEYDENAESFELWLRQFIIF
ncbi:heterokaryon incompatibility protein-domain-containing protein [Hypomontagnella monticulosa]|nr:heterokaryon incompatibility protein-domain-containing protein [Hypomontagnella monticulosa]